MVQKQNKNIKIARIFKSRIKSSITVDKVILFGSRVKGTFDKNSDFDIVVVSKDFKDIPWHKRAYKLYLIWDQDSPLELFCYTPTEVDRKKNTPGIISEALNTGTEI